MKVKLLKEICCPEGSFVAGDEPDLLETTAIGLIDGGYAELLIEDGDEIETKSNNTTGDGANDIGGSKKPSANKRK